MYIQANRMDRAEFISVEVGQITLLFSYRTLVGFVSHMMPQEEVNLRARKFTQTTSAQITKYLKTFGEHRKHPLDDDCFKELLADRLQDFYIDPENRHLSPDEQYA